MTRAQKRTNKLKYHGERPRAQLETFVEVSLTKAKVARLQAENPTLVAVKAASEGGAQTARPCFFKRDWFIY